MVKRAAGQAANAYFAIATFTRNINASMNGEFQVRNCVSNVCQVLFHDVVVIRLGGVPVLALKALQSFLCVCS